MKRLTIGLGLSIGVASTGLATELRTVRLGRDSAPGTPAPAMPGENVPSIKVNTVGYPVGWSKIAIFNVDPTGAVLKDQDGGVVLAIGPDRIASHGTDISSQDPVWQVDLSSVDNPGTYTLEVGDHASDPFAIAADPYRKATVAGVKSFYFQRTRTALQEPWAVWEGDSYLREGVSHIHEDVGWDLNDYPDKKQRWELEGGWHDAGNYDIYVPSAAPSAQALLMAWLWAPEIFDDDSNIPESGNGTPDVLDEARWGLLWILSMQQDDGGFRHREAVLEWSPELPADQDETERWVAGVSTAGTAKAVAVLALASEVYSPYDPDFAARCKQAAKAGWDFLGSHERIRAQKTGDQPLWDDEPGMSDFGARFIAAVAMWRYLGDEDALSEVRSLMRDPQAQPGAMLKASWANVGRWGMIDLALDEKTPEDLRKSARERVLEMGDQLITQVQTQDGYRCASSKDDYIWGHNSILMAKVHILAAAERLQPDRGYLEAARDQWHWVLGRNPNGYSMVTRVGRGPTRMYHMEWGAMEPPPPGFMLGGPNGDQMFFLAPGAPAKALLWENPSQLRSGVEAHSLWHWQQSDLWDGDFVKEGEWTDGWWAVTEPDVLYSANFVLAAASVRG